MKFYLGSHMPNWLYNGVIPDDVPLFIARQRLVDRCKNPTKPARMEWCMDSGGFTELEKFGAWTVPPSQYVKEVRFYSEALGNLKWASPQDWMCEPFMIEKTGLSVEKHQRLTTLNFLELKTLAPDLPFVPVLQGWSPDEYVCHWEMYEKMGVHLEDFETVGLGSVCRRQNMNIAARIVRQLVPLKLHGFGFKTTGLKAVGHLLASADSLSWSLDGRKSGGKGNCPEYALAYREKILGKYNEASRQLELI